MARSRQQQHGFTLLELVFTLLVFGVLVGLSARAFEANVREAEMNTLVEALYETRLATIDYYQYAPGLPARYAGLAIDLDGDGDPEDGDVLALLNLAPSILRVTNGGNGALRTPDGEPIRVRPGTLAVAGDAFEFEVPVAAPLCGPFGAKVQSVFEVVSVITAGGAASIVKPRGGALDPALLATGCGGRAAGSVVFLLVGA